MSKVENLINKTKELLKKDDYPEVIETCADILEINSDNEFALRFMGISNFHLKNFKESEKYLEKAYQNNPKYDKIVEDYGMVLLELDKLDKALSLYDDYFKSPDIYRKNEVKKYFITLAKECSYRNKINEALKCYDYYLNHQIDEEILSSKINLLIHLKRFDDCMSCYDLLIDLEDDEHKLSGLYYDKILCLEFKALKLYDKFIKEQNRVYPDGMYVQPINYYVYLEEMYTCYTKSLEIFWKKVCFDKVELKSWYNHLSNNLANNTNPEEFFDNLFNIDSEDTMGWCNKIDSIGYVFRDYAYNYYDLLLERNPDSIQILNKKAEFLYYSKPTVSLKLYERILELNEYDKDALKQKLRLLYKLKWYGKAYEFIKSLPDNMNGITSEISDIAELLTDNKKYSEAIYCYEKLLQYNPSEISSITNIKKIWKEAGMKEAKKNSKYYLDWIDVIISRNDVIWCPKEGCNGKLCHIVQGFNGKRLLGRNMILGEYIDCDENATHYCPKCKKEYEYGVECFNYDMNDSVLYEYAVTLILAIKHYILNSYTNEENINILQERLYTEYHLDKREVNAFINKLEKLNYINKMITLN
ncbi:IBR domain-containing protein [Methanosphaera sp. BMS]|uniref:tetratricopeptide repeat protein n=1 Tax=Methanosphaera sp. BMS TaxID=1789762 RepID=UPI000DC1D5E0|nr:IBR domain-containing protein [Methanosphaera sp. BMS]AWX31839.1 hypothetical protein AW729_01475 [Methanosphaera sp. BMS]